jgi:YfiR/HmsC-like
VRTFLLALGFAVSCAAAAQPQEHEVKAAFLFKFLSFVEWPAPSFARAGAPLVIGVLGADEVHFALQEIVPGRSAQGRPLEVRQLREGERPAGVHLLFVGRAAAAALPRLPAQPGLLVVSEVDGALEQGAMINFLRVDGRVRFEVAPDAAERRGLRISSRMLAVAQHVKPGRL